MIKYANEQFFLSVDDELNASSSSKVFWDLVKKIMKGSGSFMHIPALHDSTRNEHFVDDESKSDPLTDIFDKSLNYIIVTRNDFWVF